MKTALMIAGPDVPAAPLGLLSGTFEEKLEKAAALGCRGIELMVRDPARLDRKTVASAVAKAGLAVPQLVTGELFGADGLCLLTSDEALYHRTEKRLEEVVDFAVELGAMVNIGRVRGQFRFLGPARDPWAAALERLGRVADGAARKGVRITVEPLNRYESDFIHNADEGLRLIRDLGRPNVGLMLDFFHMNIEDASIPKSLEAAGDRLWHVHISDTNRRAPGNGHMDFAAAFRTLRGMNYAGYVSAEILPLPDPDAAARQTMDFLRRLMDQPGNPTLD